MNILFLAYWGLNDGLTSSTVMPHIRMLSDSNKVSKIILCTIERNTMMTETKLSEKLVHVPWNSSDSLRAKFNDLTEFPEKLVSLIRKHNVTFMFCRGTPAGAIGYLVHRKTNIAFAVESFEPHADYMRESGVWRRWGVRYILQKYLEKKQLKAARFIMPVSRQYYDHLAAGKVEANKLFMMPCAVDLDLFAFNMEHRQAVRNRLGVKDDAILGIYVGKFGGMYYDAEAYHIFSLAKKSISAFRLLILSPDLPASIEANLVRAGYLRGEYHIKHIPYSQVPAYLSAADFAFATYKPGYFKRYLSPVKIGEYWAAGLPVLLTDGVGDDHSIIRALNIGSVFSYEDAALRNAFTNLKKIVEKGRVQNNQHIQPVALKYRNMSNNKLVYDTIITSIAQVP
jgi:glycosyltransferase involved in cell wall biosynthesis